MAYFEFKYQKKKKKFIIEVEEGMTEGCDICPFQTALLGACKNPPKLSCLNYDLTTMKIEEYEDKD